MRRLRAELEKGVRTFDLRPGRWRLGAASDNDIILSATGVSRRHAEMTVGEDGVRLVDLGSKNRLIVGNERRDEVLLTPGVSVRIGEAEVSLEEVSTADGKLALSFDSSSTVGVRSAHGTGTTSSLEPSRSPMEALALVRRYEGRPLDEERGRFLNRDQHFANLGFSDTFQCLLRAEDLDGDQVDEVIGRCVHLTQWPSYAFLFEPRHGRLRLLLKACGHHEVVGHADVDGDGELEVLLSGINNCYGWKRGLAAVDLDPPLHQAGSPGLSAAAPGDVFAGHPPDALLWYVLLPTSTCSGPDCVTIDSERKLITVARASEASEVVGFDGFRATSSATSALNAEKRRRHRRGAYRLRRGRRAELPYASVAPQGTYDLFRYWNLEFRHDLGEAPATLLPDVEGERGKASEEYRGLVGSLGAYLLMKEGRIDEALATVREAYRLVQKDRMKHPVARAHYDVVARRRAAIERAAGHGSEAARVEDELRRWQSEQRALRWDVSNCPASGQGAQKLGAGASSNWTVSLATRRFSLSEHRHADCF